MADSAPQMLVARPALSEALRASIRTHDLTALIAPAGYGKTSALSLALAALGLPFAWYTAELWHEGEFAEPLVAEVRQARAGFGRLTLALAARRPSNGDQRQLTLWAQRLGATFAGELAHVEEPIAIVLDDVHLLEADNAFAQFLVGTLRAKVPTVRLVICGRTLPAVPMAEWHVQGRARTFGPEALRLSEPEIVAVAELRGVHIDAARARDLEALFEGWPAGIALQLAAGDAASSRASGVSPESTAYLLEANLAALGAPLVDFLETTAVFETLDASSLEREVATRDVRAHLRELERRGVMVRVVKPGSLYRLHPLLREALIARVRARDGEPAIAAAHGWAAGVLERADAIAAALYHLERAGSDERLGTFLRRHAYRIFNEGHGERAGRIVSELERRGAADPVLAGLIDGMLLRQRGDAGAIAALLRGLDAAEAEGDASAAGVIRTQVAEERLARGQSIDASELNDLRRIAQTQGGDAEVRFWTIAGWAAAIEGRFEEARDFARRATRQAGAGVENRVRSVSLEAYAATCLGDFEAADAMLASMLHDLESSDRVVLLANTAIWFARFALLWGDVAAAKDYAKLGLDLSQRLDLPAQLAGVELALAEIYAHEADVLRCREAAKAASVHGTSAWYAADALRSRALAGTFVARALFAATGPAAALRSARETLETQMPAAQRATLLAEAAAYAKAAHDPARDSLFADAVAALQAARAVDAVDAVALSGARGLLELSSGMQLDAPVATAFDELLRRREDLRFTDLQLLEGRGPRFERALTAALGARAAPASNAASPSTTAPSPAAQQIAPAMSPQGSTLTKRETQILELLAQGLTNKEIAQRFTVSPRTVDTHVERVLSKLGATTRTRAVASAIRAGIVAP